MSQCARRRLLQIVFAFVWAVAIASLTPAGLGTAHAAAGLPGKLSDQEFWNLTEILSEPNGSFRSENFLSNERGYQFVIPGLVEQTKPGGVYLGVGPEQNFSYIVALKSRMAFIIDVRRGNLLEHLLYKALFELSDDRADFLSHMFSRKRPAGLAKSASAVDLFAAYEPAEPTDALYRHNEQAVTELLTRKHHFKLSDDDIQGLHNIYHHAFFTGGLNLTYSMGGGVGGGGNAPTYRELMEADDGMGSNRGYLANEENFAFMKVLESRNLVVPVVGNFGGPKAIRAVGMYVKEHGATVVAFYLSNVEQYLVQDGIWDSFCASVATLPLDETSTFIYSGAGAPPSIAALSGNDVTVNRFRRARGGLETAVRPILGEARRCAAARN